MLDGVELHGTDELGSFYHIVCLGSFEGMAEAMGLAAGLQSARAQGGFLVLAHPAWTGNTVEEALRHPFEAVEAYNHVCAWLNGKGSGLYVWDAMLEHRPDVLGLAADDAHITASHPGMERRMGDGGRRGPNRRRRHEGAAGREVLLQLRPRDSPDRKRQ